MYFLELNQHFTWSQDHFLLIKSSLYFWTTMKLSQFIHVPWSSFKNLSGKQSKHISASRNKIQNFFQIKVSSFGSIFLTFPFHNDSITAFFPVDTVSESKRIKSNLRKNQYVPLQCSCCWKYSKKLLIIHGSFWSFGNQESSL